MKRKLLSWTFYVQFSNYVKVWGLKRFNCIWPWQFWNPIWPDCGRKKLDRTAIKEKQKYNIKTTFPLSLTYAGHLNSQTSSNQYTIIFSYFWISVLLYFLSYVFLYFFHFFCPAFEDHSLVLPPSNSLLFLKRYAVNSYFLWWSLVYKKFQYFCCVRQCAFLCGEPGSQ